MDKRIVAGVVVLSIVLVVGLALGLGNSSQNTPTTSGSETLGKEVVRVRDGDWIRGNEKAAVTLFEYSDFQCPACASYAPTIKRLMADFPDQLREVYRYFPLTQIHVNAIPAAKAAEAAGRQGKFWEMGEILFTKQKDWEGSSNPADKFLGYAKDLGLNTDKFKKDMDDQAVAARINVDLDEALKLNLSGTPTFFINGRAMEVPGSYLKFKELIQNEIARVGTSPVIEASVFPTFTATPSVTK